MSDSGGGSDGEEYAYDEPIEYEEELPQVDVEMTEAMPGDSLVVIPLEQVREK